MGTKMLTWPCQSLQRTAGAAPEAWRSSDEIPQRRLFRRNIGRQRRKGLQSVDHRAKLGEHGSSGGLAGVSGETGFLRWIIGQNPAATAHPSDQRAYPGKEASSAGSSGESRETRLLRQYQRRLPEYALRSREVRENPRKHALIRRIRGVSWNTGFDRSEEGQNPGNVG